MSSKLIIALLSFVAGYLFALNLADDKIIIKERIKYDTIIHKAEPIIIEKFKTKTIVTKDTLILSTPFLAIVDTILLRDTVYAEFIYPENEMSIAIRRAVDSIPFISKEKTINTLNEDKVCPWYEQAGIALGSFVLGAIIFGGEK